MTRNEELDQLRARVAELEEELDAWRTYDTHDFDTLNIPALKLRKALGMKSPGVARLALALYRSPVKRMSHADLEIALPPVDADRQSGKLFHVMVCHLRTALGKDAVETFWGWGWGLTPKGIEMIRQALSETE